MDISIRTTLVPSVPSQAKMSNVISVKYPRSRITGAYVPTAKLVDQMFRTGQMVTASKAVYDFPDGKDTGTDIPLDRTKDFELPEFSQELNKVETNLKRHKENLSEQLSKKKGEEKKEEKKEEKEEESPSQA